MTGDMTGDEGPPKVLADGTPFALGMRVWTRREDRLETTDCVLRLGWNPMYERSGWQIALAASPHLEHPLDEFSGTPSEWTAELATARRKLIGLANLLETDGEAAGIVNGAVADLEKLVRRRAARSGNLPYHRRDGEGPADFGPGD